MAVPRPLILIPSYNTGPILRNTISGALSLGLPLWVVIDGSTDGSPALLDEISIIRPDQDFRILRLEQNGGKGAAVLHGLRAALEEGYTHLLTMDADGQHPASMISEYIRLSMEHPECAVLGRPIFDSSAPSIRVSGRKIANFWTNVETLGWGIDDSLFGMRLYPAQPLLEVMESTSFARRFDFEPEVAVRLAWKGIPMINLPTPVRYPSKEEGGVSHFHYLRDNILLTGMYFRLFAGFLFRLPFLVIRGGNPLESVNPPQS